MELKEYLDNTGVTMSKFAQKIERAQSLVSRLCAKRHYPDPSTAANIVIASRGKVTLNELYDIPKKYWG